MTPIRFYNTLSRTKEEFHPGTPGRVGIYTCGPTVYLYATIGNFKTYVFSDVLRRTLEYNGLEVTHVMNVTDVGHLESDADEGEDKIAAEAERQRLTPWEIAAFYRNAFFRDAERLNILKPSVVCDATAHVPEMLAMVKEIVKNGYGYEASDGIYFDISKYPEYGQLSGIRLDKQQAGARVEVNSEKRNPADFLLWRKAPKEHIMQWESPWGMGYPGWHIECSAMSREYLGDRFDIHTGGIDHIPIHHENEIAQSWACTGKVPARFWMHSEFLQVDGGKMSKSLGNFYTIGNLMEKGFEPLAFRYFCLGAQYRTKLNFTWVALTGAQTGLQGLRALIKKKAGGSVGLGFENGSSGGAAAGQSDRLRAEFTSALNDDLNTPRALAVLWEAAKTLDGAGLRALAEDFDKVLALDLLTGATKDESLADSELPAEVLSVLSEREQARNLKDWARSDLLRVRLREMGYEVRDSKDGQTISKA